MHLHIAILWNSNCGGLFATFVAICDYIDLIAFLESQHFVGIAAAIFIVLNKDHLFDGLFPIYLDGDIVDKVIFCGAHLVIIIDFEDLGFGVVSRADLSGGMRK